MRHLYFRHANGELSFVAKNVGDLSDNMIWTKIYFDLKNRNPDFVVRNRHDYYTYDGRRWFDVGASEERYVIF